MNSKKKEPFTEAEKKKIKILLEELASNIKVPNPTPNDPTSNGGPKMLALALAKGMDGKTYSLAAKRGRWGE